MEEATVADIENVDKDSTTISQSVIDSKDVASDEKNENAEILNDENEEILKEDKKMLDENEEILKEDEKMLDENEEISKEDEEEEILKENKEMFEEVETLKEEEETEKEEEIEKESNETEKEIEDNLNEESLNETEIDKDEKEMIEQEDEEDDEEIILGTVAVDENTILLTEDGQDTMVDESVEEFYEPQVDIFSESFNNTGELEEDIEIDEPECIKKKINYTHPCDKYSRNSKSTKTQYMSNKSSRSKSNVRGIEEQILHKKSEHRKNLNGSQKAKFAVQLESKLNPSKREPDDLIIEEQCRVCLSKEPDLVNIFSADKTRLTVAAKIMQIAPTVKIERKDSFPQRICDTCLESVNVAFNLKTLCEWTDKDLRSRVQKIKVTTKSGRLTAAVKLEKLKEESEESVDDDLKDVNFKVESNASESNESDTDISYEPPKKKKMQKKRMTRSQQKKSKSTPVTKSNLCKEEVTTEQEDTEEDETNIDDQNSRKGRAGNRRSTSGNQSDDKKKTYPCPYCKEILPSTSKFKQHRKIHTAEGPFKCNVCGREFKFIRSYTVHLENHKKHDYLKCEQCNKSFNNKYEQRNHMYNVHSENSKNFICEKCNKSFTAKVRLEHHQKNSCNESKRKKSKLDVESLALGKDLFKFVAPLTTTYWSDSFSD